MSASGAILMDVLGRSESLFKEAIQSQASQLRSVVAKSRILIIGAGGSIGAAFVKALTAFRPTALHLVDLSENNLVRLIRELRAEGFVCSDLNSSAIGFDELEFESLLKSLQPFDFIFNFAALKHVRSERDPYTAMRLLRINVIANHVLLQRLSRYPLQKYFCVSSDKAVNPGSLMGASKAFMERVCLAHAMSVPFSTARFANVAFSDGSLLESFYQRLESGQPLAGPIDVRRYFISHQEAGELCLLAGFIAGNREIFTPKMDAEKDLKSFPEIATAILRSRGLKPLFCHSAKEAIEYAKRRKPGTVEWPCFFAPSDTGGEKPFEEFYADSETVAHDRFANIAVVTHPRTAEAQALFSAVDFLESLRQRGDWRLGELLKVVRSVIPEFKHIDGELDLDRKL